MTYKSKIEFVNYSKELLPATHESSKKVKSLPITPDNSIKPVALQMDGGSMPVQTVTKQKNKPILLINIYDGKNSNTNYTKTINDKKLNNALFIYLSNERNSGYSGGLGSGTAAIGNKENTFGIITGQYDKTSKIKYYKENGSQEYGFQSLDETNTFKLYHRADKKIYDVTPKKAIDYLLSQLSELIQKHNYEYIILPCDLDPIAKGRNYHKYTLGSGIFNVHPDVKRYIYDKICAMTQASSGGWQLITEFLK